MLRVAGAFGEVEVREGDCRECRDMCRLLKEF